MSEVSYERGTPVLGVLFHEHGAPVPGLPI